MSNARQLIGLIVVATMTASAASSADQCVDEHIVKYVAETPEWLSRLQVELATPEAVEKAITHHKSVVASPHGTARLLVDKADMMKAAPWTTRVYVVTHSPVANGVILTVRDHGNGGVRATWLNEKLVFLQVWWGRIRSTDLVLDVGLGKWIYAENADYMADLLTFSADTEKSERHAK
jgi:hypothetical protein